MLNWEHELSEAILLYVYWQLALKHNGPVVTKEVIANYRKNRTYFGVGLRVAFLLDQEGYFKLDGR